MSSAQGAVLRAQLGVVNALRNADKMGLPTKTWWGGGCGRVAPAERAKGGKWVSVDQNGAAPFERVRRCLMQWRTALGALLVLSTYGLSMAGETEGSAKLVVCAGPENDLVRVAGASGIPLERFDSPEQAVPAAPQGAGVLVLGDGYPAKTTELSPALFDVAAEKGLRLYVEYPAALPGIDVGRPKAMRLERVVVTSDAFGPSLPRMRIAMINACHLVEVQASAPHLVAAKVAGVDRAVFGLKDTPSFPILFEHPRGDILVSTTKLSHFVTGRYMPQEAWSAIWKMIFAWLQPGRMVPELQWTPTVRPTYSADEPLPPDA